MTDLTSPQAVRHALLAGEEIALIDLREEGPYALAHPLFAAQLSPSRLELDAFDRIPRKATPIVLYDDGEGLVAGAAATLGAIGYTDVTELEGGLQGWANAGYELFQDVNSASKAFGELVEARRHTPYITAEDARAAIETDADIVVLDARRFDEYRTMSIPKGVSVPGAELVLRAREIAPDPATTIIVNCAGRTRSIIGAQSLINAGVPNRVVALRNGTIGWTLAGQTLETGREARFPEASQGVADDARTRSRKVAYRAGVKFIDADALALLERDTRRTLYRFDVRTPEEYAAGRLPGFRSAPGGQLVQETDMFAPVRGARIVVFDDRGVRANMTASWLAQMGWDAYVLEETAAPLTESAWRATRPDIARAETIGLLALAGLLERSEATVVDLSPSKVHARGHIPGAWFAIRARLAADIETVPVTGKLVFTAADEDLAHLAAADHPGSLVLAGGTDAWTASGLPIETGLHNAASAPDDIYRRPYEGTDNPTDAMQAYLDWEYGLVAQLERDATHGFRVI